MEYWTNNTEAKFIISFRNTFEKQSFLKKYRNHEEFSIDFYLYSKCRLWNIEHTHMVRCHAIRNFNDKYVFEEILSKEIPF